MMVLFEKKIIRESALNGVIFPGRSWMRMHLIKFYKLKKFWSVPLTVLIKWKSTPVVSPVSEAFCKEIFIDNFKWLCSTAELIASDSKFFMTFKRHWLNYLNGDIVTYCFTL